MTNTVTKEQPQTAISRQTLIALITVTFSRLVINMTRRFPYPFIGAIARQLGTPISSVQNVMAAQAAIGVTSPVFGPLSERYGRKRVMIGSLSVIAVGSMIAAVLPQFWIFALVIIMFGLGKFIYDPAMQAYIGDRIPYHRRGFALGVTELSWAFSLIIIAPIAGFLLATSSRPPEQDIMLTMIGYDPLPDLLTGSSGLQSVFALLFILCVISIIAIWVFLPGDRPQNSNIRSIITPMEAWRVMRGSPAALGALAYMICLSAANEIFFINYGLWMEQSFDLVLAALGLATTIIALAEIGGEAAIITLSDRLGKKRMAMTGAFIAGVSYVCLPLFASTLSSALIGLFIMFLAVEIGIVGSIPLFSEILPESRAIMMSGVSAAAAFGRLVGALLGGSLFQIMGDFVLIGLVATVIGCTAAFTMWRFVHIVE